MFGLSYFGARYYDPAIGRFMGVDPKGFDEGNLASFNRYAYGNNNPYRYRDPDGRFAETVIDVISFGLSLHEFRQNPNLLNGLGLAYDGVAMAVPFLPAGVGLARNAARAAEGAADAARAAGDAAKGVHPTFNPGPHAGESIPARGPERDFNAAERAEGKRIFNETGCHTCGTKNAGTKNNDPVLDHQPVSSLNREGAPQRLYPQCLNCSRDQGLAAARALREEAK